MTDSNRDAWRDQIIASLATLDERTKTIAKDIVELKGQAIMKTEFDAKFGPIQKIVYGVVAIILLTVFGVILFNSGIGR